MVANQNHEIAYKRAETFGAKDGKSVFEMIEFVYRLRNYERINE